MKGDQGTKDRTVSNFISGNYLETEAASDGMRHATSIDFVTNRTKMLIDTVNAYVEHIGDTIDVGAFGNHANHLDFATAETRHVSTIGCLWEIVLVAAGGLMRTSNHFDLLGSNLFVKQLILRAEYEVPMVDNA